MQLLSIIKKSIFIIIYHGRWGLGLDISSPVPSLFSFCIANHPITAMTGTVVEDVQTSIVGTKMRADGPLLITHWGLSGPAVLKLSSYGARHLHDCGYNTKIAVNWFGSANENEVMEMLYEMSLRHPQKQVQDISRTGSGAKEYCFRHLDGLHLPHARHFHSGRLLQHLAQRLQLVATV